MGWGSLIRAGFVEGGLRTSVVFMGSGEESRVWSLCFVFLDDVRIEINRDRGTRFGGRVIEEDWH